LQQFAPSRFRIAGVPWSDSLELHFVPALTGKPKTMEQIFNGGKPDISESVPVFQPTAAELSGFSGDFVSEEIDPIYRISIQDGKLTLNRLKHKLDTLSPTTTDVFTGDIGTVRFTRDSSEHISGFILDAGRIQNFRFTRKAD
jgi:hypothetical protein